MEYLLPAIVTLFVQFYKWLLKKTEFNTEQTSALIIMMVFATSAFVTFGYNLVMGKVANWAEFVQTLGLSITYFELVWKRIFIPVFDKIKSQNE